MRRRVITGLVTMVLAMGLIVPTASAGGVDPGVQGDWSGVYGADGYALGAFEGNGASDLVDWPKGSVALVAGDRYEWKHNTSDVRALESPDQSVRRAASWYQKNDLELEITFDEAYTGDLHIYSIDWGGTKRRQTVTVDDGNGPQVATLDEAFHDGAWMHFAVDVAQSGTVSVMAHRDAGANATISGLFLGGTWAPPEPPPPPGPGVQGDWSGVYGAGGYALGAFEDDGASDLVSLTGGVALVAGARHEWKHDTADVRALESPDQSFRRASGWYQKNDLELEMTLDDGFDGSLHIYAIDWGGTKRRQTVTVDDGNGAQVAELDSSFNDGAWMHFTIDVAPGGTVSVMAHRNAGANATLSGLFLGDDWTPPDPPEPPPTPEPGVQGDWAGVYGADGYALGAFEADGASDLVDWPLGAVALVAGDRHEWKNTTTDVRALESPDQAFRRAASWYQKNDLELEITFDDAYEGDLHIYSVDWGGTKRRQTVTVDDGNGPQVAVIDSDFNAGAWMHFTLSVPGGGGTVSVMAHRDAGANATISGIFLGGTWTPPDPPDPPPPPPGPEDRGDWVGTYGADGYVLGAFADDGASDLAAFPKGSVALTTGDRFEWDPNTTDVRALEDPAETFYRAATWFHSNQLVLTITFDEAYTGDLHVYAVDWSTHKRRQTVTVDDGSGPQVETLSSSFKQGAWMHFTVDVQATDEVTIVVDKSAGSNAVISGIFLGGGPPV